MAHDVNHTAPEPSEELRKKLYKLLDSQVEKIIADYARSLLLVAESNRTNPMYAHSVNERTINKIMQLIQQAIADAERRGRIDEIKMMRELLPLQPISPIEIVQGKTSANEYIKKRLAELQANAGGGERDGEDK